MSTSKNINLVINKLTKEQYNSLSNELSTTLSDQLFFTMDEIGGEGGGGNVLITCITQNEYNNLSSSGHLNENIYYATY